MHIMAMTANTSESAVKACLEAGMNDVLGKPLRLGDLDAKLQAILPEISAMPPLRVEPSALPTQNWEEAWKTLMQVTLNNRPLAIELLQLAVHENQARSLKLQAAHTQKDYETLRAIAHQIRGSHGNLGLSVLTALAAELESCASSADYNADRQAAEINRIVAAMTIAIQELETFVTEKFPGAKIED